MMVSMFDREARLTKTCPGNPPTVTKIGFDAGFLAHILWQKNIYRNGHIVLKGTKSVDTAKSDAILDLLPPGPARDLASQQLQSAQPSTSGLSSLCTWEWELTGEQPP